MDEIVHTTNEPDLQESVQMIMRRLPPVIRQYLAREEYTPIVQRLVAKYSLHVDQGGVLEREVMLLLMGLEAPTEFIDALTGVLVDRSVAYQIVRDINTQILIPIREKMERETPIDESREAAPMPPPASPRVPPPPPFPASAAPTPAPSPVVAPAAQAQANLPGAVPPVSVPVAPPLPVRKPFEADPYREPIE